jgi:hypothetical protein
MPTLLVKGTYWLSCLFEVVLVVLTRVCLFSIGGQGLAGLGRVCHLCGYASQGSTAVGECLLTSSRLSVLQHLAAEGSHAYLQRDSLCVRFLASLQLRAQWN